MSCPLKLSLPCPLPRLEVRCFNRYLRKDNLEQPTGQSETRLLLEASWLWPVEGARIKLPVGTWDDVKQEGKVLGLQLGVGMC